MTKVKLADLTPSQLEEVKTGRGHVTRFSDSSLYDEICILCGARDNPIRFYEYDTLEKDDCPIGMDWRREIEDASKD